jgi:hypothetical protein
MPCVSSPCCSRWQRWEPTRAARGLCPRNRSRRGYSASSSSRFCFPCFRSCSPTRSFYLLYPIWVATQLPIWLIEPRYLLVPVTLLQLFRRPERRGVEWALVIWQFGLSWLIYAGTLTERWFV